MAVGAVGTKMPSFEEWLTKENKTSELKRPPSGMTDNGVPNAIAEQLHDKNTSVFQFVSQSPAKDTVGANGASAFGAPQQPTLAMDGGTRTLDSVVTDNSNTNVLAAGATGHSAQTQGPSLASGLRASQGNENSGAQGGATDSKKLNTDLYRQYEEAVKIMNQVQNGDEVSTGEGTLSTGGAEGADGANGVDGTGGTGADGAPPVGSGEPNSPGDVNPNDPANSGDDNQNPTDSSNDSSGNINKQEEKHQQEVLNREMFKKLNEQAA